MMKRVSVHWVSKVLTYKLVNARLLRIHYYFVVQALALTPASKIRRRSFRPIDSLLVHDLASREIIVCRNMFYCSA